jgi:hypothetical protein
MPSANAANAASASARTPAVPTANTVIAATPAVIAATSHAGAGAATRDRRPSSWAIGSPSAWMNIAAHRPATAVTTRTASHLPGGSAAIAPARASVTNTSTSSDATPGERVALSRPSRPSHRSTRSARPRSTRAADASDKVARPTSAEMPAGSPAAWSSTAAIQASAPIGTPTATSQPAARGSSPTSVGHRHGVEWTSATAPP